MRLKIKLIVGIGNPGAEYANTRHNAGIWFVCRFAEQQGITFTRVKKFFGRVATTVYQSQNIKLLLPDTYMNLSGRSVGAIAAFYRIKPEEILIAHDELDLTTGSIRFKQGGGLAGHNGLGDITRSLGNKQSFNRLRIGVGHPGNRSDVLGHVLGKVSANEARIIYACLDEALRYLPDAVSGEWQHAMSGLNGFKVEGTDGV